jgi:hypothetical protein
MKLFPNLLALILSSVLVDTLSGLATGSVDGLTPATFTAIIKMVQDFQESKRLFVHFKKPTEITGKHAFKPSMRPDQRGPCRGLNALANHAYISCDGVTRFAKLL